MPCCPCCGVEFLDQAFSVGSEVLYPWSCADHVDLHLDVGDNCGKGVFDCVMSVEELEEVVC